MKKNLFWSMCAAVSMLFASSCSEDEIVSGVTDSDFVNATFNLETPDGIQTRATEPVIGKGKSVNNVKCAVFDAAGNLLDELTNEETVEEGKATFQARLVKGQQYRVAFFAYHKSTSGEAAYDVADMKNIIVKANQKSNDETRDAFTAYIDVTADETLNAITKPVKLYRPFAQLNLGSLADDIDAAKNAGIEITETTQSSITVSNVYTAFNAYADDVVGDVSEVTFSLNAIPEETLTVGTDSYKYLALNYLLVGGKNSEKSLTNVKFTWKTDDGKTNNPVTTFKDVPVQRNFRTNIIGYLLTNPADFKIEIDATFDGNKNVTINEQAVPVGELNDLLEANKNETKAITYKVESESTDPQSAITVNIPANTQSESLTFDFSNTTFSNNATITINNSTDDYNNPVTIIAPEGVDLGNLSINLPNSHVELKQGTYTKVVASTSSTTLVIPQGVTIGDLTLEKGNAEIYYGAVTGTIVKATGCEITWLVDTKEQLVTIATRVNDGITNENIKLVSDIDLNNENWMPIGTEEKPFTGCLEGNNMTIKNLNIIETEAKEGKAFIGFFGYAKNVTIKNVTFENVNLNIPCLDIDHSQGHIGAVAGSLEGTSTIENVTVKGNIKVEATFDANGASRVAVVAGGNSYGDVTMKNVHVKANEGSYLKANNNTGALAGQLQGKNVFENCSSNIDVTVKKFFAGGLIGLAAGDSKFTNCHTTGDVTVTAGRAGNGNDHYRVGGIAGGWADGKTKVCTLTNCSYTGNISGTNTDGSVANPLDYAGFVGRGYTLNGCAGSKVIIDGDEYVQATDNIHGFYIVNGVYEIGSAAGMQWFANEVNVNKNSFSGKTVKLVADIDLNNENWTPIGQTGATTFNGIFDGQNHTISNLTVNSETQTGAHYSSGLFGWVESHTANHGHIKNVKIAGATITGHHNCGALVGYITQETALVENCHVTGATISCTVANDDANGDKAGALIGNATAATPVKNCTATKSSVSAGRDAGQVIGAGKEANVVGCSATEVTVTANGTGTGSNVRNEVIGRLL